MLQTWTPQFMRQPARRLLARCRIRHSTLATWPAQLFSRDQWPHILQGGILPAVVALGCSGHSSHHSITVSGPGSQRPFSGVSLPPVQDLPPPPSPTPPPLPMAVACRMGLSSQPMTLSTCLATAREKRNAKCLHDMKQQPRQTLVDKSGSVASQAHQTNGSSQTRPPIAGSSPGAPSSGPSARAWRLKCPVSTALSLSPFCLPTSIPGGMGGTVHMPHKLETRRPLATHGARRGRARC
jgi:hypothetical protein